MHTRSSVYCLRLVIPNHLLAFQITGKILVKILFSGRNTYFHDWAKIWSCFIQFSAIWVFFLMVNGKIFFSIIFFLFFLALTVWFFRVITTNKNDFMEFLLWLSGHKPNIIYEDMGSIPIPAQWIKFRCCYACSIG